MERVIGALGHFGDARRAAVGSGLLERVMETGSLVIRKLGRDRAGEMAFHRFLSAPSVSTAEMIQTLAARTAQACAGRRIVAVQDTTEISFAGREERRRGLGPSGDGISAGFFVHPLIAVDGDSGAVLGVLDAQIWTRSDDFAAPDAARPIDDKESIRWLRGAAQAATRLNGAASVTVVADREGDIYESFARRPEGVDLIVRAAQDRALRNGGRLFAAAAAWPELARITVTVTPARPGTRPRSAIVALRAGAVTIARPADRRANSDPAQVTLTLIEAREIAPVGQAAPLLWRLLTTRPTADAAAAEEIIALYRLRWRIEEVFRALKSDGMRLEETQMHDAARLFKLAVVGLAAATRTLQLVDARDGGPRPATDVIDAALLPAADAIAPTVQGKTARQQNPHPPHSLAWLAWIVARLGGWNCYYKPPGPKTMRAGWATFAATAAGFLIATLQKSNV